MDPSSSASSFLPVMERNFNIYSCYRNSLPSTRGPRNHGENSLKLWARLKHHSLRWFLCEVVCLYPCKILSDPDSRRVFNIREKQMWNHRGDLPPHTCLQVRITWKSHKPTGLQIPLMTCLITIPGNLLCKAKLWIQPLSDSQGGHLDHAQQSDFDNMYDICVTICMKLFVRETKTKLWGKKWSDESQLDLVALRLATHSRHGIESGRSGCLGWMQRQK